MPRYEYTCRRCGESVEKNMSVEARNTPPSHFCSDGSVGELRRKFSSPGFRIEGRAYLYPSGTDWAGEAGLSRGDI